jgi:hypothetical protein
MLLASLPRLIALYTLRALALPVFAWTTSFWLVLKSPIEFTYGLMARSSGYVLD